MPLTPPTEKQLRLIWLALTALAVVAIAAVIVAFVWGFGKFLNLLSPVLWPLAIAAVLAYLLDPAVDWLHRQKLSRTRAIVVVFAVMACVMAGITAQVVPQLIRETSSLVSNMPAYTDQVRQRIEKWADGHQGAAPFRQNTNSPAGTPDHSTNYPPSAAATSSPGNPSAAANSSIHNQIISSAKDWFDKIMPAVGDWLLGLLGKFTVLLDVVIALILIPIYTFYFLREKYGIQANWTRYLPVRDSRLKEELVFVLTAVNQYMITFFRGQVIVALISGALYTIAFFGMGLDYALLLGFLAVILLIIPFVGVMILSVLTLLLTAVQFHDFFHPALVVGVFAVVQTLEIFFYAPRIMGNRVNLHPVVVLIALMAGITLLGGLLGGILAIPLAAALRVIMFRYVWKKSERGGSHILPK
jgi:predicted PurR-regulated permease PerM